MPVSPPPSSKSSDMYKHDIQQLVAHNANTSYPQPKYEQDEGMHLQPRYNSPTILHDETYLRSHQQISLPYPHQYQDSPLGIHYEYNNFHAPIYGEYSTPGTSPATPKSEVLTTRSGLALHRSVHHTLKPMPEGQGRGEKAPKPKVKKEKVKAEKKVARIEKPLSELTKDIEEVPVIDVEAYVNRSVEERRREVEEGKSQGKVKRPMNSFMLYRKAYQNRAKHWCLGNNHQVVSQVCGDSWPLEPDEIREKYTELARVERINHQNAHPGYKFSPTKPGTSKNPNKRKMSEDLASDVSDLSDFDWQGGRSRATKKSRTSASRQMQQQPVVYPTRRSAYQYSSRDHSMEPDYSGYNKSPYQVLNTGSPHPSQYSSTDIQSGQYYQPNMRHNQNALGIGDIMMQKTAASGVHSYQVSIPGGPESDMMHSQQRYHGSPPPDSRIDPSLMANDQGYQGSNFSESHPAGLYFDSPHDAESALYQAPYGMNGREMDPHLSYLGPDQHTDRSQIHDQQMGVLHGSHDGWQDMGTFDNGQQFDDWMKTVGE
ncbi:HMG box protein [Rutstroemia sp. NJR-2017a WRK4]|nr:HMG box protein [Rutstroemia sp. NJR-2017a WRK4]